MRTMLHAGWIAGVALALALGIASLRADLPAATLLAVLGSVQADAALAWNLSGFVLPGVLVAVFAVALEAPMRAAGAARGGRIGSTLLLLSGVFFAAQGLLPYDLDDPDTRASQLHVTALSLSLLAFLPATALIAASVRRAPRWAILRTFGGVLAAAALACLVLPPAQWLPGVEHPAALAQRTLLALYFGWIALASAVALRAVQVPD
ncbi:DUF998 domain-containing protein [Chiayiivirga flava]|uniref:Putative membrane protein n=1 Tax=Chiayiivirga flava TaxID=659595 RepID=A0A7W8D7W0_9GAMM|nr:DUF998 domain-containing protein [Chiayiivirga flava]MBB5209500.1 putative membrane protein [Chiayiivirga flava]